MSIKRSLAPAFFSLVLCRASLPVATLQGYIRDAKGRGVGSARVKVQLKTEGEAQQELSGLTDSQGSFHFSLHEGSYTVRASKAEVGDAQTDLLHISVAEVKRLDLVLRRTEILSFFDEPKFTVAGVTDHTYAGGHGSEATVRSAESLTKATAALSQKRSTEAQSKETSDANLHHQLAEVDERTGRPLDAVREYQRAAELDPSEANLFDWGTELLVHWASQPASAVFEQGIKLFPNSSRMLLGDGASLYALGQYSQAANRLFQATDLNPSDPNPYLFLGAVQRAEITESAGFLERVARFAKLQPENAHANYLYASALWRLQNNSQEVQALLLKALRLDSSFASAYLQLGIVYAERQDLRAAIDAFQQAIQADPQMEQAHYRLAQAYRSTGDMMKAQHESAIFQELSRASTERVDHERSELLKFVVTLKSPASLSEH